MAAAKKLATTVHVTDEAGEVHILAPGKKVPEELAKLITNPKAWASGDASSEETEEQSSSTAGGSTAGSAPVKPPVAGSGSGKEAWAEYATAVGITVPDDANKGDIVALVADHEAKA